MRMAMMIAHRTVVSQSKNSAVMVTSLPFCRNHTMAAAAITRATISATLGPLRPDLAVSPAPSCHFERSLLSIMAVSSSRGTASGRPWLARQAQQPFADDVALHLAGAAGDAAPRRGQHARRVRTGQ